MCEYQETMPMSGRLEKEPSNTNKWKVACLKTRTRGLDEAVSKARGEEGRVPSGSGDCPALSTGRCGKMEDVKESLRHGGRNERFNRRKTGETTRTGGRQHPERTDERPRAVSSVNPHTHGA